MSGASEKAMGDVGLDWIDFIVFDGAHEFDADDAPIKKPVQALMK